jgi:hypothetical protein
LTFATQIEWSIEALQEAKGICAPDISIYWASLTVYIVYMFENLPNLFQSIVLVMFSRSVTKSSVPPTCLIRNHDMEYSGHLAGSMKGLVTGSGLICRALPDYWLRARPFSLKLLRGVRLLVASSIDAG